jgi:hypothetical protein
MADVKVGQLAKVYVVNGDRIARVCKVLAVDHLCKQVELQQLGKEKSEWHPLALVRDPIDDIVSIEPVRQEIWWLRDGSHPELVSRGDVMARLQRAGTSYLQWQDVFERNILGSVTVKHGRELIVVEGRPDGV